MLRLILAIPILLFPNALHLGTDAGVAGLNYTNLLFLVLLVVLAVGRGQSLPEHARKGYLSVPLTCLFVVLAIGFVMAQWHDTSNAMEDLTRLKNAIFYPLLYFVYRRCGLDQRGTQQLIVMVMAVSALAALEAVMQGLQFGFGQYVPDHRASGPFGDYRMANRAGVFFAMFLPLFTASALLLRGKPVLRFMAIAGGVITLAAIMFTYSRQAYAIALLGLSLLLMRRSMMLGLAAIFMMVVMSSLLPGSVISRMQDTMQSNGSGPIVLDSSTESRLEIWKGALQMWMEHPFGVGLGRFSMEIGSYSSYSGFDAHNAFILMLAECGIPGLLVMFWLFWRMWLLARDIRHVAKTTTSLSTHAIAIGFTITVISTALSNLYGSPFFEGLIMANFWILCGLVERHAALIAQPVSATPPMAVPDPVRSRFPLAGAALPDPSRRLRKSHSVPRQHAVRLSPPGV